MEEWTISRLLSWTKDYFEKAHLDAPSLDAQILLGHVLNMNKVQLIIHHSRIVSGEELARFKGYIIRRAKKREPIAYIIGKREFWGLDFKVTHDVLIPRPDTESLVQYALDWIDARMRGTVPTWMTSQTLDLVYEPVDDRKDYFDAVSRIESGNDVDVATLEDGCRADHEGLSDHVVYEAIDERRSYFDGLLAMEAEAERAQRKEDAALGVLEEERIPDESLLSGLKEGWCSGKYLQDTEKNAPCDRMMVIADVGTGSGCIALSVASEVRASRRKIFAFDISPKALCVAAENATRLGLTENVVFEQSDLLQKLSEPADLILSNPPYITETEMEALMPEVQCEPRLALAAGDDGLAIYRRLVAEAYQKLADQGMLMVEIGSKQSEAVKLLFRNAGFQGVRTFKDYAGLPRVVIGMKSCRGDM